MFNTFGGSALSDPRAKEEINTLLKMGAYGAIDDADDTAATQFQQLDIDQILKSRAHRVEYQEDSAAGLTSVTKATFKLAGTGQEVDISDPDFWNKVLGPTRVMKLMEALNSGEVVTDRTKRKDFYTELVALAKEVVASLAESEPHEDAEQVAELLLRVQSVSAFTPKQLAHFAHLMEEIHEPRRRKRKTRVNMDAAGGGDEQDAAEDQTYSQGDVSDGDGAQVVGKRKRVPPRRAGWPDIEGDPYNTCAVCFRPGEGLVFCAGDCHRMMHVDCGAMQLEPAAAAADDAGAWRCAECVAGEVLY